MELTGRISQLLEDPIIIPELSGHPKDIFLTDTGGKTISNYYSSIYEHQIGEIKEFNNYPITKIQGLSYIITEQNGNNLSGFFVEQNVKLTPICLSLCFDVWGKGSVPSLAEFNAFAQAMRVRSVNIRPKIFKYRYPTLETKVLGTELIKVHRMLTGSCIDGITEVFLSHRSTENTQVTIKEYFEVATRNERNRIIKDTAALYGLSYENIPDIPKPKKVKHATN